MKLEELKENLENYDKYIRSFPVNCQFENVVVLVREYNDLIFKPFSILLTELGLNDEEPSHLLDESFDI